MKKYAKLFAIALSVASMPAIATAQMTIDELEPTKQEDVRFRDLVKESSLTNDYYSLARDRAERARIRKERNTFEIIGSLQGSLTAFNDPWIATSGGDNNTAVVGSLKINHAYKKDKFTLTSRLSTVLGFNRVKIETDKKDDAGEPISEGVWYKNQDEIFLSVAPTIAISSLWSYGGTVAFRTQFANGYVSRSQQNSYELKSGFMAPGYFDISGGMTYKSPNKKYPFTVNIAPLAMSAVYVSNDLVQDNFCYKFKDPKTGEWTYVEPYGVSPYVNSKYEGGSSIRIDYDKTFEKLANIRYTTSLFSFYGWMTQVSYKNIIDDHDEYQAALEAWNGSKDVVKPMLGILPTVRWENTLSIPATDVLSTTVKFQLYYNRAQTLKIQTQTYLSVGLSYTFKNK